MKKATRQFALLILVICITAALAAWVSPSNGKTVAPDEIRIEGLKVLMEAYLYELDSQCWFYIKPAGGPNTLTLVNCPRGI